MEPCNDVTTVTTKQFMCKTCNAGPFGEDDKTPLSGNILDFHKEKGCEIIEYEKGDEKLFSK